MSQKKFSINGIQIEDQPIKLEGYWLKVGDDQWVIVAKIGSEWKPLQAWTGDPQNQTEIKSEFLRKKGEQAKLIIYPFIEDLSPFSNMDWSDIEDQDPQFGDPVIPSEEYGVDRAIGLHVVGENKKLIPIPGGMEGGVIPIKISNLIEDPVNFFQDVWEDATIMAVDLDQGRKNLFDRPIKVLENQVVAFSYPGQEFVVTSAEE